ncbi:MAG: metallophosphoesterase [Thaumarchaeota archaeon]|jgi:putative SbcD/Mre11-related phosphoesterase|nr:metallophosphoesterase [Nitrososphaerota archaeon]
METKKFIELFKNVEVYDSIPALFLVDVSAIVISDLHLGYEVAMAEKGIFLPKIQYEKEVALLKRLSEFKFKTLVLNGDIKYEFSESSYHEYKEVLNFLDYVKTKFKNIVIVRGNHDTFITRVTKKFQLEVVDEIKINKYLITHGHILPESFFDKDWETIIIGHEHPSIALFDELGIKDKLECFLYGKLADGRNLVVSPAFSYVSTGSEINLLPKEELLSPILREYALVDELKVLAIDEEAGPLYFGKLGNLRNIT